jgi:hypothetical protein
MTDQFNYINGIIPSYLYQEFSDDQNIQAFIDSFNLFQESYLTFFKSLTLPIYQNFNGPLLDWIIQGIYGKTRPILATIRKHVIGPLNTFTCNQIPVNGYEVKTTIDQPVVDDDLYKRCMTWAFQKNNGKIFSVLWLKQRIVQFLAGVNGIINNQFNPISYQISVTFGVQRQVTIAIINGKTKINNFGGCNAGPLNVLPINGIKTTYMALNPLTLQNQLIEGINTGVLELPFQFQWTVIAEGQPLSITAPLDIFLLDFNVLY